MIERYLGRYATERLGISLSDLLAFGRSDREDTGEHFNMAYLALHGSGTVNGVSELHGRVSRLLFSPLFPRLPINEVPVGHVTNGVHMPTWDSAAADLIWAEACGQDRWRGTTEHLEDRIRLLSDEKIWTLRGAGRAALVEYAQSRVSRQMAAAGADADVIVRTRARLNPRILTLGFARRFATYKRPNLLLHDPARLLRILTNRERPVQLLIAGKAHPADLEGQSLIREWTRFIRHDDSPPPVVFIADYDMLFAEYLVQGVDVWLNTPRRPWEACGTSGMKVLVNGGLNLSEIDGWWAEAYRPDIGWALGDGREHGDDPAWDAAEAEALYDRLEQEIIPEFHRRDEHGRPVAWISRIRESMARLTPMFSATRAVTDYTDRALPAAAGAYRARAADHARGAVDIMDRNNEWRMKRDSIRIDGVKVEAGDDGHVFAADLFLGEVNPASVRVELYADGRNGDEAVKQEMKPSGDEGRPAGAYVFCAVVSSLRPPSDYTVRVIRRDEWLNLPLEDSWILWRK